jgi:phosphoinositide-3-kinase, regulatory subunit 4
MQHTSVIIVRQLTEFYLDGPALIILSLVCANLRSSTLPSSKLRALDVFLALCVHLTDEAKLDRMVPYIVDLLHDEAAIVRSSSLRTLVQVVRRLILTFLRS